MISGINIVLVSAVAVLLVLYLLRRRTRIVLSRFGIGAGTEAKSSGVEQPI